MEKKLGSIPQLPEGAIGYNRYKNPLEAPDPKDTRVFQEKQQLERARAEMDVEELPDDAIEPLRETEPQPQRDVVAEALLEAQQEAVQAESAVAKKMAKSFRGLSDVLSPTGDLFVNAYTYFQEGAQDFAHDVSDTFLTPRATDGMKGLWQKVFGKKNHMFGEQNAEKRPSSREYRTGAIDPYTKQEIVENVEDPARFGIWGMLGMEVTTVRALWDTFSAMPGDIGKKLNAWSEDALQERREVAFDIEQRAREARDHVFTQLEAEEKALYSKGLSEEELATALENIQDRRDNASGDYADELQKSKDIAPSFAENAAKGVVAAVADGFNYLAMDGLVAEMAQNFTRGLRQERRKSFEKVKSGTPYSRDVVAAWGPQERAMGVMERFGEALGGVADRLREARTEHQETIVEEIKQEQRAETSVYQDALTSRIESLTQKTKISPQEKGEIAYLVGKIARARQGELGAEELALVAKRAEAFAKKAETQKDDENLLMGYLAGRAINTLRSLNIMQGHEGENMIRALQQEPNPKNLRRAEALVYAHVERELSAASEGLLSEEDKAKLQQAREVLQESVARATELYKSSLTTLSADITKGVQAATRDLKKAAAQAEAALEEERAAA